jgi:hemolysin activation/secretion protein
MGFALSSAAQSTPPPGVTLPPNTPDTIQQTIPTPSNIPPAPPVETPIPLPEPLLQNPLSSPPEPSVVPDLRFFVRTIEVVDSTVLQDRIAQLIAPFENREVSFEELIELRSNLTQLYIQNGYITSGVFLPNNQDLSDGVVQLQVVEGRLERIEITGLTRLQEAYVRDRLTLATSTPLNQKRLETALQLLQLNPLIRQVNAELTAGSAPGRNVLNVSLREAPPLQAEVGADNYQSSSIGSDQLSVQAGYTNVLGLGDRINAAYGVTDGLDSVSAGYTIPLNAQDGTLALRYSRDNSRIVEAAFQDVRIRSNSETFSLSFRQPLEQRPEREFALGFGLDLRRRQTFRNDQPFSFSEGPDNGESRVAVVRFSQDWLRRDVNTVLAARSQFSLGINAFSATINESVTDGRFFSWLGQFQWVQRFSPDVLLISRVNAQLTPDSLLSLERFGFGGVDTVRGYPQNQLVTDNAILGSVETRFSLTDDPNRLQLIPFLEAGYGWNNRTPDPDPSALIGTGLGLRWAITPDLAVRLDYGIPLINLQSRGDSLQDNGFYFSASYQPF